MHAYGRSPFFGRLLAIGVIIALLCPAPASGAGLFDDPPGAPGRAPEASTASRSRGAVLEVAGALGVIGLGLGLSLSSAAPLFTVIALPIAGAPGDDADGPGSGQDHGQGHGQ